MKSTRCAASIAAATIAAAAGRHDGHQPERREPLRHSLRLDRRRTETTSPFMRYAISIDWDCFTADLGAVA